MTQSVKILSNFNDVRKYLSSHEIDTQAAPSAVYLADLVFHAYSNTAKIHPVAYSPQFCFVKGGHFWQLTPEDTLSAMARSMYSEYMKNPSSFKHFLIDQNKVSDQIESVWRKSIKEKQVTYELFKEFVEHCEEWWLYGVIGEDKGKIAQEEIVAGLVAQHGFSKEQAYEVTAALSHPDEMSGFALEKAEFLKLCIEAKEHGKPDSKKLEKYISTFFYKNTSFYERAILTEETVLQGIQGTVSQKSLAELSAELTEITGTHTSIQAEKKVIKKSLSLSVNDEKSLEYLQIITQWVDDRKLSMMKQFFYLISLVHRIADQCDVAYDDISRYPISDVLNLLKMGTKLSISEVTAFNNGTMFCYQANLKPILFTGSEADELYKITQHISDTENIKGMVASKGAGIKITGTVQIIRDPKHDVLQKGNIMVTSMTRPEFVPMMKDAAAIVTDEGGIACHAAIVSRELKKLCVIGTKKATKVLKSGDIIEIDPANGIVRKII